MASPIPIENLFYVYCYAWNLFPQGQNLLGGTTSAPSLKNLLAKVLVSGLERQIRRGLDRGYISLSQDLPTVRGRILIAETVKRQLLDYGRAHCEFDELSTDVLQNQILKTSIVSLAEVEGLDAVLAHRLRELALVLSGVSVIRLSTDAFRRVQLHRNNSGYSLLLRVCQLIFESLLPTQESGRSRFVDVLENEEKMSAVFETFIRNFANSETEFEGGVEHIRWDSKSLTEGAESLLPIMKTDATLRSRDCTLVVEAKYYRQVFDGFRGSKKFRSTHLYQIFAYLKNLETRGGMDARACGLLLYPTANMDVDEDFTFGGHRTKIRTLNLNRPWKEIHESLIDALRGAVRV